MSGDTDDVLAESINALILQIHGVLRVFPANPPSSVVRAVDLLRGRTEVVGVHVRESYTEVVARLGIAQISNALRIIDEVQGAVRDATGGRGWIVYVEIAVVE